MNDLTINIILGGTPVEKMVPAGGDKKCPPATQDIELNVKNRQEAIDKYNYGPLNPSLDDTGQNDEFWQKTADVFGTDIETAQTSRCGNCAAFNVTSDMLDCIAKGIGDEGQDPYDSIDAGDIGYCQFLKFKCASSRVCTAWVVGGPIKDNDYAQHDIL